MKKILLSLLTVGLVTTVGVFATRAFFSDVETSTGNTFTAGTIDLMIQSDCYRSNEASGNCGVWDYSVGKLSNQKFFNFTDLKPGDWGENTVSFKVLNNDAWMCANMNITSNSDLGGYLNIFWWVDDGDNIYQSGEKKLYTGPMTIDGWLGLTGVNPGGTGSLPLTFADSYLNWRLWPESSPHPNTVAISANDEQHLGIGWCFGVLTADGSGPRGFTCNPAGDHNNAQGDNVVGDLSFSVEQTRNNPDFLCPEHRLIQ
ncbi:MAG: SipW-dependent-type signal peptide-containing protein [Candidatus Gottesmanbacteria bacterium]